MNYPDDLYYSEEHTWVKVELDQALIGISDYAQDRLGDIVFLELPGEGDEIKKDHSFGVIESTKTVSELYGPVSGKIIEINKPLIDSPELINEDPYGDGWMLRIELTDPDELDELMHADEYEDYVVEEAEREEEIVIADEDEDDDDDDDI